MSEISKIKMPDDSEYNIKDSELRHMMNVLLGIEPAEDTTTENNDSDN